MHQCRRSLVVGGVGIHTRLEKQAQHAGLAVPGAFDESLRCVGHGDAGKFGTRRIARIDRRGGLRRCGQRRAHLAVVGLDARIAIGFAKRVVVAQ